MKVRVRVILALMVALSCSVLSNGQASTSFSDVHLYDEVVNLLFPVESHQAPGSPATVTLQCSYGAGSTREIQIRLTNSTSGTQTLEVWYVPSSLPSIWTQLGEAVAAHPGADAAQLSKQIKVSYMKFDAIPSEVKELMKEFEVLQYKPSEGSRLFLEGMRYGLRVEKPSNSTSISLFGPEDGLRSTTELIRWMTKMRLAIQPKLQGKS